MRDEDGFLTNPFPDMRDAFSARQDNTLLPVAEEAIEAWTEE